MSNRKTVIAAISKLGQATLADLDDACTGMDREKVRFTLGDIKKVGLVKMGRDDVTGMPAYSLTANGKAWLAAQTKEKSGKQDPKPVEGKITGSQPSGNSLASPMTEGLAVEKAGESKASPSPAGNEKDEILNLQADLVLANGRIGDLQAEVERLEGVVKAVQERTEARVIECQQESLAKAQRILDLENEITYLRGALKDQADKINSGEQPPAINPTYWAVTRPKKPMQRFTKEAKARAAAMATARSQGLSEVFALIPVGKAVRGAEWKAPQ